MRSVLVVAGLVLAGAAGLARAAEAPVTPAATPRPLVVRIGVSLVQVDAVVTDGRGHHVTDLKAEDFEIRQDGKPRAITQCRYVVVVPPAPAAPAVPSVRPRPAGDAAPAPAAIRPEDVRRVMTLVVDDLNLSSQGLHRVSDGLARIVREDLRPGDLMAIVRTSGGAGVLHQLTNDRRVLEAAVRDLRGRLPGIDMGDDANDAVGGGASVGASSVPAEMRWRTEAHLARMTFATLKTILEALRDLPGRKSVVLFSERLQISAIGGTLSDTPQVFDEKDPLMAEAAQSVTDLANRSSAVLYTVDPRGPALVPLAASDNNLSSAAGPAPKGPDWQSRLDGDRERRVASQTGMEFLARQTGGRFFAMENRVEAAVADVREDQTGYYLLGYEPEEGVFSETATRPVFHTLEVKVKRAGLTARSRAGFSAVPDDRLAAAVTAGGDPLVQALISPFALSSIPLRLTPVFGRDPKNGYVVRAYVHLDGAPLTFADAAAGGAAAKIEILAAVFSDEGEMLSPVRRNANVKVAAAELATVKTMGLVLDFTVPVAKPGTYQLRLAVCDTATGQIGTAREIIDVPDLSKKRLALSGVVLGSARRAGDAGEAVQVTAASRMSPALRRFAPGAAISYALVVYHASMDEATKKPRFALRARFVRPEHEARETELSPQLLVPLDASVENLPGYVVAGSFALPAGLEAGSYGVEFIATDRSRKERPTGTRWTSLEIVPDPPAP
jgi:VWFA-related protein